MPLAVSSLAIFKFNPREDHRLAVIKTFGFLKKHPKRGIVVDFVHQHCEFNRDVD